MPNIKNIEMLPKFIADVKNKYGEAQLHNGKFVVAIMSDLLPGAMELKRCIRMVYESNAMTSVLEISKDSSNLLVHRNKAIDKLIEYSFMDKQIATSIIDAVIASVYPAIKVSASAAKEQYLLGVGHYEKKEHAEAVACYQKAAEQEHAEAQYELAHCLEEGTGVEEDLLQAIHWYKKAAEKDNQDAQNALVRIYQENEAVIAVEELMGIAIPEKQLFIRYATIGYCKLRTLLDKLVEIKQKTEVLADGMSQSDCESLLRTLHEADEAVDEMLRGECETLVRITLSKEKEIIAEINRKLSAAIGKN